jgi:hypothetical protein
VLTTTKPPKCKHCKERTDKIGRLLHEDCVDPWLEAQRKKQAAKQAREQRARAKVERAEIRRRKEAIKRIPDLIAEAQDAFNEFIRLRDRDRPCFVCERPFLPGVPGRVMHAGHVRSRGAAGHLRFHEDNCHGECEGCNGPRGAKPHEIEAGAVRRIGQARFDALKTDNAPHKWTREELRGIRDHYRAKVRELKKASR